MTDLFNKLPKITYNGAQSTNLTVRAEVYRRILRESPVFYDYMVKDGERPDTIAYDYYGSSDYTWLVLLSANVFNPYTDWLLPYKDFNRYLFKKYGNIDQIMSAIDHYQYTGINGTDSRDDIERRSWTMSPISYQQLSNDLKSGWSPVSIYQKEEAVNEKKRLIKLLSNVYIDQVDRELEALFSGNSQ